MSHQSHYPLPGTLVPLRSVWYNIPSRLFLPQSSPQTLHFCLCLPCSRLHALKGKVQSYIKPYNFFCAMCRVKTQDNNSSSFIKVSKQSAGHLPISHRVVLLRWCVGPPLHNKCFPHRFQILLRICKEKRSSAQFKQHTNHAKFAISVNTRHHSIHSLNSQPIFRRKERIFALIRYGTLSA